LNLRNKHILLLLDYDGTLTPIVSKPSKAKLSAGTKRTLRSLSKKKSITLGIISGRALKDVKRLVGIKGIYYAGNHGFEIVGPGIDFIHPSAKPFKQCRNKVKKALKKKLKPIKGVKIEDKALTLSVHYRMADAKGQKKAIEVFKGTCARYEKSGKARLTYGKKVCELRPAAKWNKASAASMILGLAKDPDSTVTIYAGDDTTDEDVFRALGGKNISICVGKKLVSSAEYYVKDTDDLQEFLKGLL